MKALTRGLLCDCKTSHNLHEGSFEALDSTALLTADNPEHREVEGWDMAGTLGPKTDFMCTMAATSAAAAGRAKVEVFLFLENYSDWSPGPP